MSISGDKAKMINAKAQNIQEFEVCTDNVEREEFELIY
jgi:hypothetical protein